MSSHLYALLKHNANFNNILEHCEKINEYPYFIYQIIKDDYNNHIKINYTFDHYFLKLLNYITQFNFKNLPMVIDNWLILYYHVYLEFNQLIELLKLLNIYEDIPNNSDIDWITMYPIHLSIILHQHHKDYNILASYHLTPNLLPYNYIKIINNNILELSLRNMSLVGLYQVLDENFIFNLTNLKLCLERFKDVELDYTKILKNHPDLLNSQLNIPNKELLSIIYNDVLSDNFIIKLVEYYKVKK